MNRGKPTISVLPVRPVTQQNSYECGLACVQSLMAYSGRRVARKTLKMALGTNKSDGTLPRKIKEVLKSSGVPFVEKDKAKLADLEKQLKKGRLCLVAYQAWGAKKYFETRQSGHYSVVFGFEKDFLWLMDPNVRGGRVRYRKGVRKIKKDVFEKRWVDEDAQQKVYDRWYLAVGKPDELPSRKLKSNLIYQKTDYDCGVVAVATLLKILDKEDLITSNLEDELKVSEEFGTDPYSIQDFLKRNGVIYNSKEMANLADIERVVKKDGYCLITYQAWGTKKEKEDLVSGHYSIVFDIDDKWVWLWDPSHDKEYTKGLGNGVVRKSRKEFRKMWVDKLADGEIIKRWMISVIHE